CARPGSASTDGCRAWGSAPLPVPRRCPWACAATCATSPMAGWRCWRWDRSRRSKRWRSGSRTARPPHGSRTWPVPTWRTRPAWARGATAWMTAEPGEATVSVRGRRTGAFVQGARAFGLPGIERWRTGLRRHALGPPAGQLAHAPGERAQTLVDRDLHVSAAQTHFLQAWRLVPPLREHGVLDLHRIAQGEGVGWRAVAEDPHRRKLDVDPRR